jgi:hypothetical protein
MLEYRKYKLSGELYGILLCRSDSCSTEDYQHTESVVLMDEAKSFCKNYVLLQMDDDQICEQITQTYSNESRLNQSDYVVNMVRYLKIRGKVNFFCIFNHFCSYGHVVQLRNYPDERNRTSNFSDAYKQPPELSESVVIEILRAAVKSFTMVALQAATQSNYRDLRMKLNLKKVLVCGQLPSNPIVRLS